MADLLDLDTRRRMVDLVRQYPGLHLREIARQLGTSVALVEYHVPALVDAGLLRVDATGGTTRAFARGTRHRLDERERQWLVALRGEKALQVTLWMLAQGRPVRHAVIATALSMSKATLTFHLRKLIEAGIMAKRPDRRFEVVDAAALNRLLVDYRPTGDLLDRFAALWAALYD